MEKRKFIIDIDDLDISLRSKNGLKRIGITTLNALEDKKDLDLFAVPGLGIRSINELNHLIVHIDDTFNSFEERIKRIESISQRFGCVQIDALPISDAFFLVLHRIGLEKIGDLLAFNNSNISELRATANIKNEILRTIDKLISNDDEYINAITGFEAKEQRKAAIFDEVKDIPTERLFLSVRSENALLKAKISFVGELLNMSRYTMLTLQGVGNVSKEEISKVIDGIILEGKVYIDRLQPPAVVQQVDEEDPFEPIGKGFDFPVIDLLTEKFAFKPLRMTEWFGLSRQGIYNALEKKSLKRRKKWTGKEITDSEKSILIDLITNKKFNFRDEEVICYCLNNRQDDFACLFIYDDEIKCYFMKDLPSDLRENIENSNFHKYTEKELSDDASGSIVSILKQKYFIPNDHQKFRSLAAARDMSLEEYSVFLTGYPYANNRNTTDEKIIEFFEANTIEGRVYISSDTENIWIRSYASRNGYTIKEFVEFYGYKFYMEKPDLYSVDTRERHIEKLKKHIVKGNMVYVPVDSSTYRLLSLYAYNHSITINKYIKELGFERTMERPNSMNDVRELDMEVRASDGKFVEQVFAQYPLIGSKIIKPETLNKLNEFSRKYIDYVLNEPKTKLTLQAEMQITLALINYAKKWVIEENSEFWDFISLQFGYRNQNKVIHLLQISLENSLKKNHRLFIEDSKGRAFKSTAVLHALTTKKSWMALYDFLFDFYKNNLNWRLIPGDPLLDLMVETLQKKFAGEGSEESELTISSRVYSIQEGIRKLVLFRPVFSKNLFEKLLKKIDDLVNSKDEPSEIYEEQLGEEWFKEKLITIANTKQRERQRQHGSREVAIDYSRIRAKFILRNENDIQIVLPDIRLKRSDFSVARLLIYQDDNLAFQQDLTWYGNEFGRTLNGIFLPIPRLLATSEAINLRVQIKCDNDTIYDSENTLFRQAFVFAAENEINLGQIKRGNYTLTIPSTSTINVDNAELVEIDSFKNGGLKAFFVELRDGYAITVDGKLLAFDGVHGGSLRVITPAESINLPSITSDEGESYFAYYSSACNILLSNKLDSHKYLMIKDRKRIELSSLPSTETENGIVFTCSLATENKTTRVQIINIDNERLLFDKSFVLVSEIMCTFNREFYYSSDDYEGAKFSLKIDEMIEEISFGEDEDEVRIPFGNGEIHVRVPKIILQESTGAWLDESEPAWYIGDIPQNSILKVGNPEEVNVKFYINDQDIKYDGNGIVTIGNALQSISNIENIVDADIKMVIIGENETSQYILTRIFYKERFLKQPEFWSENGILLWNQGGKFMGDSDRRLTLTMTSDSGSILEFAMNATSESVNLPENLEIGNYRFEISIFSGGLFKKVKETIAEGDCVIGDPNLLRFQNRRIVIESITDEYKEETGHIGITPCYIDKLKFQGMQDTSEGYCPVYSGILYSSGFHGERYEFSFDAHKNSRGISKMMVNPVRIVYVGEATLCITDSDGDGLYYYYYYDKYTASTVYALTDHEYSNYNKHKYSNADLYTYHTERI